MATITTELTESLFGKSEDDKDPTSKASKDKQMGIGQLESMIKTMSRFFNGINHRKVTLMYGPDGSSWAVDISHSPAGEGIEGMDTRVDHKTLLNDDIKPPTEELLADPVVVRYGGVCV